MSGYFLSPQADQHLDDIYEFTARHWSEDQADSYISTLFDFFGEIAAKNVIWRSIPAEFGVEGYVAKCNQHIVYWKALGSGELGIVAVLHERMHQIDRMREIVAQPA